MRRVALTLILVGAVASRPSPTQELLRRLDAIADDLETMMPAEAQSKAIVLDFDKTLSVAHMYYALRLSAEKYTELFEDEPHPFGADYVPQKCQTEHKISQYMDEIRAAQGEGDMETAMELNAEKMDLMAKLQTVTDWLQEEMDAGVLKKQQIKTACSAARADRPIQAGADPG